MILADTSIWVDHFRKGDAELARHLDSGNIAMHPYVLIELMLGHVPNREENLIYLELLPAAKVANGDEVRRMIAAHSLSRRGIGFVDAHLVASALITPDMLLWSRDKRLLKVAEELGVGAELA
jgi:predicted nucleic acid-binding protein